MRREHPTRAWAVGATCLAVLSVAALSCRGGGSGPAHDAGGHDALGDADVAPPEDGAPDGGDVAPGPDCSAGSRTGAVGETDGLSTAGGVLFNVRAPESYDPELSHPLIVAYAPSGGTAGFTESATGLTPDALEAGFVIAYVDHVSPVDVAGAEDVAAVSSLVAELWCVDESRLYLTGSSDGASVIYTIVLNDLGVLPPAAIAPFAAGVSGEAIATVDCLDDPLPVMVLHNTDDTVFPGYGAGARDWWVSCNGCSTAAPETLADGCLRYLECDAGAEVRYCEGPGGHGSWPDLNDSMLAFFDRSRRSP